MEYHWQRPNDPEAEQFSRDLFCALAEAEWIVDKREPLPDGVVGIALVSGPPEALRRMEPLTRAGASGIGVTLVGRTMALPPASNDPVVELSAALRKNGVSDIWTSADTRLADDHIRVFVGQKP